jgi:hypothetical protein
LEYFPLIAILYFENLTQIYIYIYIYIACSKHSRVDNPYFFQMSFFPTKFPPFFFIKLERILTLMIKREKGIELMKIIFITDFNTFGSNVLLTLKIMDFENVVLTKFVHIYVIEGMSA